MMEVNYCVLVPDDDVQIDDVVADDMVADADEDSFAFGF